MCPYNYMHLNLTLLIERDESEWTKAFAIMRAALGAKAGTIGLRPQEYADALSSASSALLSHDCRVLRRCEPTRTCGFIRAVVLNNARDIAKCRRRRDGHEIPMSNNDLAALHDKCSMTAQN